MSDDAKVWAVFGGGATLVGALLFSFVAWVSNAKCERAWARSGMKAEWALVQGCVIQRKDGTWIPASAYREVHQ